MERSSETQVVGRVHDGFDVFGIPHGGYLAALAGAAMLEASGQPDLFTITIHFNRKASVGPIAFDMTPMGRSRRFQTLAAEAKQGDRTVLSVIASVGDRGSFSGPRWTSRPVWAEGDVDLSPVAVPGAPPSPPNIAAQVKLRFDERTALFARDETSDHEAMFRGQMELDTPDQLAALIACDATPPAAWNALGRKGWVPTVELTAHVRARPRGGPLRATISTAHVSDGFLEEDALIYDGEGNLVVQSRQLACWTGA